MNAAVNVISAFSEDQTERLTGLSKGQLRYWDRTGFYEPSFAEENRRIAYSRVYSFKDIVALRVLSTLRNQFGVSLQHLREISDKLSRTQEDRWTGVKLWVVKKKVVWQDPETGIPQEVVSGQYVVPLDLTDALNKTKSQVSSYLQDRDPASFGRVRKSRYVNHNAPVIAGTRIPVSAVWNFLDAGYSLPEIIKEYPDLTEADIHAAMEYRKQETAA